MIGSRPLGRRPLARGTAEAPKTSPCREPPTAEHMLDVLRGTLFASPLALFSNVRSAVGAGVQDLGIADAVAVDTTDGLGITFHAIEVKRSAGDLAAELADPSKADAVGRFCQTFTLVLPAPAKRFLGSRLELPRHWGVIEVDGRRAERLVYAEKRRAEPAPESFVKALFRSAAAGIQQDERGAGDAPERRIVGHLSRDLVILGPCLHRAVRPLTKKAPTSMPCVACAAGDASHPEAVAAALEDAAPDALELYAAQIDRLLQARRIA